MTNQVDMCNMALSACGCARIETIVEQSAEAAQCALQYQQTLEEVLRIHTWRWARRNIALTVFKARRGTPENPSGAIAEPEWPWTYSYLWPNNCLKIRYILPQNTMGYATIGGVPLTTSQEVAPERTRTPPIRFIESGDTNEGAAIKVILTDQYQARLIYTHYVDDPEVWDANFRTAFIGRLAGKICFPLNGDKTLMKFAMDAGKAAEEQARTSDANDGLDVKDWQPEAQAAGGFVDPTDSDMYVSMPSQEIT